MEPKTSIIDTPKDAKIKDQIGIDLYKNALVKFIDRTDTPITIAIQGEWGSGKTSLMNSLKDDLCDKEGKRFYPVWINTWQYSLLKDPEQTLTTIIKGITNEVLTIISENNTKMQDAVKKVRTVLGNILKAGAKIALNTATGQDFSQLIDESLEKNGKEETVSELRNALNKIVSKCIKEDRQKDGFVFFIDDLDRIDPPIAVQILELLKNIFDLDKCVFILAIDYDVVVKGLEPKFGKLTDANEREFRSFFDKIIQLPFSMPITSYKIDTFLKDSLLSIGYLTEDEANNDKFLNKLTSFTNLSLGNNPRSLKRLFNTLSLIEIINKEIFKDKENDKNEKIINYALVCIQIAYPSIYQSLWNEPDFINWNEKTANKFKLKELNKKEIEKLKKDELFDEEWELILFRLCERDSYLSKHIFNISRLFNKILEEIPENKNVGKYIKTILKFSSVTEVQTFDDNKENNSDTLSGLKGLLSDNMLKRTISDLF